MHLVSDVAWIYKFNQHLNWHCCWILISWNINFSEEMFLLSEDCTSTQIQMLRAATSTSTSTTATTTTATSRLFLDIFNAVGLNWFSVVKLVKSNDYHSFLPNPFDFAPSLKFNYALFFLPVVSFWFAICRKMYILPIELSINTLWLCVWIWRYES